MVHDLKIFEEFADPVFFGSKSFEVRLNDRDYHSGDLIRFHVCSCDGRFVKHSLNDCYFKIGFILSNWPCALNPGYVVFSISRLFPLRPISW